MIAEAIAAILIVYAFAFLAFVGRGGKSKGLSRTRTLTSSDVASAA